MDQPPDSPDSDDTDGPSTPLQPHDPPAPPGPPPGFGGAGGSGGAGGAGVAPSPAGAPGLAGPPSRRNATPPRPRRFVWFFGGLTLAIAAVGLITLSGDTDPDEEGPDPTATITALNEGFARGDAGLLCAQLSNAAKNQVFAQQDLPCTEAVRQSLLVVDDPASLQVTAGEVSVDGDRAAIDVATANAQITIDLVLEDDVWKIDESAALGIDLGAEARPTPPGPAGPAACDLELRTVEVAVSAYEATVGATPTSTDDLVEGGFLRELPTLATVNSDGSAAAAGPCA